MEDVLVLEFDPDVPISDGSRGLLQFQKEFGEDVELILLLSYSSKP